MGNKAFFHLVNEIYKLKKVSDFLHPVYYQQIQESNVNVKVIFNLILNDHQLYFKNHHTSCFITIEFIEPDRLLLLTIIIIFKFGHLETSKGN